MKQLKRITGWVWLLTGPIAIFFLIHTAYTEITARPVTDTWIQWGVFVLIFLPIAFGFSLFGYYAIKGEYDQEV